MLLISVTDNAIIQYIPEKRQKKTAEKMEIEVNTGKRKRKKYLLFGVSGGMMYV